MKIAANTKNLHKKFISIFPKQRTNNQFKMIHKLRETVSYSGAHPNDAQLGKGNSTNVKKSLSKGLYAFYTTGDLSSFQSKFGQQAPGIKGLIFTYNKKKHILGGSNQG